MGFLWNDFSRAYGTGGGAEISWDINGDILATVTRVPPFPVVALFSLLPPSLLLDPCRRSGINSHFHPVTVARQSRCNHSHSADEETEAQRGP